MNPLRPSPRFLRKVATLLASSTEPAVLAWVQAMNALPKPRRSSLFHQTSVVPTYRNMRLCGYEVWRHLDVQRNDPTRKKARLWFGCRRHGRRRSLQLAYQAAAMMSRMTARELREWWEEYRAARSAHRSVSNLWRDDDVTRDGIDIEDGLSIHGVGVYGLRRTA